MFIISFVIFYILFSIFIVLPFLLLISGKLFKAPNLSFKISIITIFAVIIVQMIILVIALILHINTILMNIVCFIMGALIVIYVVKNKFGANILRSVGIHFTFIILSFLITNLEVLATTVFIFECDKIQSRGMHNTVQAGDYLLVNKVIYKFKSPKRGDIIAFRYPLNPVKKHVARIVAVEGDIIEIKDKKLYINNELINETYVIHNDHQIESPSESPRDNYTPITVPENSFFVMGDNREISFDSRFWGVIESDEIVGKASLIYWSWDNEKEALRKDRIGEFL